MIELQKFTREDFRRLISWIDSEEDLVQFAGAAFKYPLDEKQLSKYISDTSKDIYRIFHTDSGKVIGHCEVNKLSEEAPNLCRILIGDTKYRGKGLGGEIVNELLLHCFRNKKTVKVELNVFDWNEPAIRCYEKAGFRFEPGKFKEIHIKQSVWRSLKMSISRKEFYGR